MFTVNCQICVSDYNEKYRNLIDYGGNYERQDQIISE